MPEIERAPAAPPAPRPTQRASREVIPPTPYSRAALGLFALFIAGLIGALVAKHTGHDWLWFFVPAVVACLLALGAAYLHGLAGTHLLNHDTTDR